VSQTRRGSGVLGFIAIIQSLLFLAHAFVFETVNYFWGKPRIPYLLEFFILVSISFVPASLLVWRYTHFFAWFFYRIAAVWLGCLSFFFWASVLCWLVYGAGHLFGINVPHRGLLAGLFGVGAIAALAAFLNASWIRVTRISMKLPGLSDAWKNRVAILAGDLHLGPVRGFCFARRVVQVARSLKPDVVFLTGDFYDGTAVDAARMANEWRDFPAQLGVFYVTGNHEEFSDRTKYLRAIEAAGMKALRNEKVTIDGLQIAGVLYGEGSDPDGLRSSLAQMKLSGEPSILLSHVPQYLDVAEQAGISLQLSGHTHKGQVFPWIWLARRVHGKFVYGLNEYKRMLVYTTSGAGTWGPPMRLGTRAEIVAIRFE
jgi:predicted MPP superfamily phosphohydrolase